MATDGALFKHYIETSRLRPVSVYKSMKISKQAFYKLYESGLFEPETIDKLEKALGKKWEDVKQMGAGVNIEEVTKGQQPQVDQKNDNLDTLIQSNKILAEANKKLSDAHFILAEDQRELMKKVTQPTANAQLQSQQDVNAMRSVFLELLFEIGSGKLRLKSVDEGRAIYRKRIAAALMEDASEGIQNDSGKKRTAVK
jgi:uncharacterized phage infection (PIP) family protein YhgE